MDEVSRWRKDEVLLVSQNQKEDIVCSSVFHTMEKSREGANNFERDYCVILTKK